MMEPDAIKKQLLDEARGLGFDLVAVSPPELPAEAAAIYRDWLRAGHHGCLEYLTQRISRDITVEDLLPDTQSVLVLGLSYNADDPSTHAGRGRISRYARFRNYHKVIGRKLRQLEAFVRDSCDGEARGFVDTGPISERSYAVQAGLGYIGRNSMLINLEYGSWTFLTVLLTTLALPVDDGPKSYTCGACRQCIDNCPTAAITENKTVDANRCLSCLTIENRGEIPVALRPKLGLRLFGCDTCQAICPLNREAKVTDLKQLADRSLPAAAFELKTVLGLADDQAFLEIFAGTPVVRAKRIGLLRNACVAAGNSGDTGLIPVLEALRERESDIMLREHATWAIEKLTASPKSRKPTT
jgi:epoxyqueuosine reductase